MTPYITLPTVYCKTSNSFFHTRHYDQLELKVIREHCMEQRQNGKKKMHSYLGTECCCFESSNVCFIYAQFQFFLTNSKSESFRWRSEAHLEQQITNR